MAHTDPDRYWVKILTPSYPQLKRLIAERVFQPTGRTLSGANEDPKWQVAPGTLVTAVSDDCIKIGHTELHAELSHLATHAYHAVITASPGFTQYPGINSLLTELRDPKGPWDVKRFVQMLEGRADQGRQPDPLPRLTVPPKTYWAVWQPKGTFLRSTSQGHYMLALTFITGYTPVRPPQRRVDVGLDLGLDPFTAAYTSDGQPILFPLTNAQHLTALERVRLSPEARKLLYHLMYASGRLDSERIVGVLNCIARRVYAERLTHRGMSDHFVFAGRDRGIHDHHFSSLPQLLNTSRVSFRRVKSWKTSTFCAHCYAVDRVKVEGVRMRERFTCPRCRRTVNSHTNAAHNVLLNGQALPPL